MLDQPTPPSSASRIVTSLVENAFPVSPKRQMANGPTPANGHISPPSGRFMSQGRAQSTPPQLTNDSRFRSLSRGTVGDLPDASSLERSWSKLRLSKKRSQYYSDTFAIREPNDPAKERVARDSVVVADLKLNCCLESEQAFLIDLSFRLSEIYQRPASCIMVMVSTEVAMLIGGNSEPAYHLTITALQPEIAATKNKRSTHLIQAFMQESLAIKPSRGVVRFEPVAEENLATNGVTALQEIEHLQGTSLEEEGILRAISRQTQRSKIPKYPPEGKRDTISTPVSMTSTLSHGPYKSECTKDSAPTETGVPGSKRVRQRRSIFPFFRK